MPLGVWVVARDDGGATAGEVATLRLSRDGSPVGTVSITHVDGDQFMVVALVGAPDDVAYYCRIQLADGSTVDSESWPAGNGAWIVPLPAGATSRRRRPARRHREGLVLGHVHLTPTECLVPPE